MPSLIDCVISDIVESIEVTDEEILHSMAALDLDIEAISAVEGGWESVGGYRHDKPHIPNIPPSAYTRKGPSVYKYDGFMLVRGTTSSDCLRWFVYEQSGLHTQ